jgi:hypothetical protein
MPRAEALAQLGPHWPPPPGAVVTRVSRLGIDHGAVAVHDSDDRPGTAWWVVDGLIGPQGAGPAPALPGCSRAPIREQPDTPPPTS